MDDSFRYHRSGYYAYICIVFLFFHSGLLHILRKTCLNLWAPMSASHWLGTNDMGYDILSELIYAASTTMLVGNYRFVHFTGCRSTGRNCRRLFSRMVRRSDKWIDSYILLIPMLPMTIILAAYLGAGVQNVILSISLLGWCSTAKGGQSQNQTSKMRSFY